MTAKIEVFGAAIIAVGDFNPAIFSPDWLQKNALIGADDADEARQSKSFRVAHDLTRFETDWFVLQVLEKQFSLQSKGPLSLNFKDLAVGIFSILSHTPVTAVGLNFYIHYKISKLDEYHKIGDVLAPKPIWEEIFKDETFSAGLENVTIRIDPQERGETKDPLVHDTRRITLQPSNKVKQGLFFTINNHFDVENIDDFLSNAERVSGIAEERWEDLWREATVICDSVIDLALKQ